MLLQKNLKEKTNAQIKRQFYKIYYLYYKLYASYCSEAKFNIYCENTNSYIVSNSYVSSTNYKFISSTTKCLLNTNDIIKEKEKYYLTVLDYRKNNNFYYILWFVNLYAIYSVYVNRNKINLQTDLFCQLKIES